MAVAKITNEVKLAIERKSAKTLPDRPSQAGLTAETIRNRLYKAMLDDSNSICAEIDRVVDEVNADINNLADSKVEHNAIVGVWHETTSKDTPIYSKLKVDEIDTAIVLNINAHKARTNNPHGVTKAQVGLGNADDTADADKPVSTAQSAALGLKENVSNKKTTLADDSDAYYPTQKAVKTAVDLKLVKDLSGLTDGDKIESTDLIYVYTSAGASQKIAGSELTQLIKTIELNTSTYVLTITKYDGTATTIDLPAEMAFVSASYSDVTQDLTFVLQNGTTVAVPLDDLVGGLASETWVNTYFIPKTALKTAFSATPLDTNVISEKLAKDTLDLKVEKYANIEIPLLNGDTLTELFTSKGTNLNIVEGDMEAGTLYIKTSGDEVSDLSWNTINPISGLKDLKLDVTVVGTNIVRPLLTNLTDGSTLSIGKKYIYRFKYVLLSGVCELYYTYDGANVINVNKLLENNGVFEIELTCNGANTDFGNLYFNGTNLFSLQIDEVELVDITDYNSIENYHKFVFVPRYGYYLESKNIKMSANKLRTLYQEYLKLGDNEANAYLSNSSKDYIYEKNISTMNKQLYNGYDMDVFGAWITPDGYISQDSNSSYAKIPCVENEKVSLWRGDTGLYVSSNTGSLLFHDKDGNYISHINLNDYINGSYKSKNYVTFTTPPKTSYMLYSTNLSNLYEIKETMIVIYGEVINDFVLENPYVFKINGSPLKNSQYVGKKWTVIGDSLTEHNLRASKNYQDYISEELGYEVQNLGRSATGYMRTIDEGFAFFQRVDEISPDVDIVTVFGSFNDLGGGFDLGNITDTGTTTICGCINTFFDTFYASFPTTPIGIILPTAWENLRPGVSQSDNYVNAIYQICQYRSVPCLDLYRDSNLRPYDATFRALAYSKDEGYGVHPDELGHKIISSKIREFIKRLL